jgi:hypothetical protein
MRQVRQQLAIAFAACSMVASCGSEQTAPVAEPGTGQIEACSVECMVLVGPAGFRHATIASDTNDFPLPVARFMMVSLEGGVPTLDLIGPEDFVKDSVFVFVNGKEHVVRFSELASGWPLPPTDSGWVAVSLPRRPGDVPYAGMLVLRASRAQVTHGALPFGESSEGAILGCVVPGPGTTCGRSVAMFPFYLRFDGGFQSANSNGPSSAIVVTFSQPVTTVEVTIADPDFATNEMVAYFNGGIVATASAPYDNTPGSLTTELLSVTAPLIDEIVLTAASGDYVWYHDLSFSPFAPSFTVVCDQNVVRGQSGDCSATPNPTGLTAVVQQWTFTSIDPVITVNRASSATTWSGVLVAPGAVQVSGTIAGASAQGSTILDVAPRDWSSVPIAYTAAKRLPTTHRLRAGAWNELGKTLHQANILLQPGSAIDVADGPNKGLYFLTVPSVEIESYVDINYPAFAVGSPWYNIQGNTPGLCTKPQLPGLLTFVEAHEGWPFTGSQASHTGRLESYLSAHAADAVESALAADTAALAVRARTQLAPAYAAGLAYSAAIDSVPMPAPCIPLFY